MNQWTTGQKVSRARSLCLHLHQYPWSNLQGKQFKNLMGDIKLADWDWLPLPRLVWSLGLGFGPLHLTLVAKSKDVAQQASPEQLYFHGRFPFKYLTDREHGAIKASRGPSMKEGNGQIITPGEKRGVREGPCCRNPLSVGSALKTVAAPLHPFSPLSLYTQNNLVSLEQKQDLSSMTYSLNLTFFIFWQYGVIYHVQVCISVCMCAHIEQ